MRGGHRLPPEKREKIVGLVRARLAEHDEGGRGSLYEACPGLAVWDVRLLLDEVDRLRIDAGLLRKSEQDWYRACLDLRQQVRSLTPRTVSRLVELEGLPFGAVVVTREGVPLRQGLASPTGDSEDDYDAWFDLDEEQWLTYEQVIETGAPLWFVWAPAAAPDGSRTEEG